VYYWVVWCNTAAKVAKVLLEKDYQVKELTRGIAVWQAMNLPVFALAQDGRVTDNCGC